MRPAISRLARSRRLVALLVGLTLACGGGGGGGGSQTITAVPTAAAPSPVASPQRPALASPVTSSSPVVPAASTSPTPGGGGGGNEQTYEIQPGDTLQAIADQFYGDASQWQKIYDANRDVIGNNPNALKIGTTLKIPPKDS